MAVMPFGLSFLTGDGGEALTALDVRDPFARLGDGDQQDLTAARFHRRAVAQKRGVGAFLPPALPGGPGG
jgi:hypothetical protein